MVSQVETIFIVKRCVGFLSTGRPPSCAAAQAAEAELAAERKRATDAEAALAALREQSEAALAAAHEQSEAARRLLQDARDENSVLAEQARYVPATLP